MATCLQTRPRLVPSSRFPRQDRSPRSRGVWIVPTLVLLAALVLAGCLYVRFLGVARALWYNPYHDRSAHYLYSLKLATDVEHGRVLSALARSERGSHLAAVARHGGGGGVAGWWTRLSFGRIAEPGRLGGHDLA